MNKAVFLDRDGVLLHEHGGYTYLDEHVKILPGIVKPLQDLMRYGYLLFIITNQGGIGQGLYSHHQLEEINRVLLTYLFEREIKITEIFYCPHHPSSSVCICRKPDSLLIEKAMAKYLINPAESFFIGDMPRDMEAAGKCGINGIKIEPNALLAEATEQILSSKKNL